jgi:hypothetical protein
VFGEGLGNGSGFDWKSKGGVDDRSVTSEYREEKGGVYKKENRN